MQFTRQEVEKAITDLTNALAAEQDKNKVLAEQKAELLELVKLFNYACKQILEGGHIDAKYYEKKCDKAIKSATQ